MLALAVEAAKKELHLVKLVSQLKKFMADINQKIKSISGIYKSKMKKNKLFKKVIQLSDKFSENHGRRPRILIAKVGQDGHDRGAKVIAAVLLIWVLMLT